MFSKRLRNSDGQALVEWVFLFPLYVLWMITVVAFAQWFLIHQELLSVARETALLYSSGRMEKNTVIAYAQRALQNGYPALSIPASNIQIGRAPTAQWSLKLDKIDISFLPPAHSLLRLIFKDPLEESCVIRHAPSYFSFTLISSGPPVSW